MTSGATRARWFHEPVAWWLLAAAICLYVHWQSAHAWFRTDDFAWLDLARSVYSPHDLLVVLFSPRAQGTIRPWSERAFFLINYWVFGLDARPFRAVIFATQFLNLALVIAIGRRLTSRWAAGFWAAVFWTINTSSMEPLGWICVYNQVLCGCFLLLAFYLLLRYIETGQARYWALQWIVFVLGFGALEINIVYPALAAGFALLCARPFFRRTLTLVPVSVLYLFLHNAVAPVPKTGVYVPHFGLSALRTLVTYWEWSVGPVYLGAPFHAPQWAVLAGIGLLTVALAAWSVAQWRRGRHEAAFCLLWYLVLIAPLAPLRGHVTEYYPFLPVIGLCWLGGWALAEAWRASVALRALATALALIYAALVYPELRMAVDWNFHLTERVHHFVDGLAYAHRIHPDQQILLDGADSELFWHAVDEYAYRLVGLEHLYLTPGSEAGIDGQGRAEEIGKFVASGFATASALDADQGVVYDARGPRLRNITNAYRRRSLAHDLPHWIDPSDPLIAGLLGAEWYPIEGDHRWMPARATVRLAGPERAGARLRLIGSLTSEQMAAGPVELTVSLDGAPLGSVAALENPFDVQFPLPQNAVQKAQVVVEITVNRTYEPPREHRALGLAFGSIAVQ